MPTTDIWNGTSNWATDDAAWSDTAPPLSTEDAEIATGTATLTSAATIAGLQVDAPASLVITTGGTLTDTGLGTVAGQLALSGGASVTTAGGLSITGNGQVLVDSPSNNLGGGSSLAVGGTLTVGNTTGTLEIGSSGISAGDTVTATALSNSGGINIQGNGTIVATLAVNGPATNNATVNIDASGIVQMGTGDIYTQAADATNIASGGTLAGTIDVTGGAVNIAAGGVLAGTANVTGGFLDGTGTVVGTVNDTSGGTVFAGPSIGTPGTLTVNGTYNQSGTGDLEANIGSGGTSSGVVAVTPGFFVNLSGGTLSVSGTPAVGSLLTVMTLGSGELVGQFAAVQDGSSIGDGSNVNLGDGTTLEVFYNADAGNIQIERVNNAGLATSYNWMDATGNWSTAADWSGGQVPNPTANVVIGNTTTGNVTLNGSSGETTVNSLSILASNALTVSGLTLTSATGGGGISVAANGTLSLSSGRIDGSVLSGAGLLQTVGGGVSVLAGDTISANTSFIGQDNTQTGLLGAIDNAGTFELIGGNGQNTNLLILNAVTLTGGGTVTLDDIATGGGNAYLGGNGETLTNVNDTILGTGIIGNGSLALINEHVIDATPEGGSSTLTLNGSGVTNTGTMEAAAGAALVINTPVVDNANGTIKDSASTSTVELFNATVQGGTLNDTAGGTLETVSSAALDGSTHGALTLTTGSTYTASDNTTTYLLGSIVNQGVFQLIGGNGNNGYLVLSNNVTLTGGGTVTLDQLTGGGADYVQGNSQTLTNTNNTIQGTGVIGNGSLALINNSVIDATPEGGSTTLTLNGSGGITNTATMEASGGGVLQINGYTVNNSGGTITVADATSTVELFNATVQGGTLKNAAGGTLETISTAALDGTTQGALTISTGSTYTASNNTTTYLLGSIVNQGVFQVFGGNGNNGALDINNSVTLTGGGTVTLDTLSGGGIVYLQGNSQTLTNTNNTIQGTGVIGNGSLALINHGVVDATPEGGTTTLTLNGSGGITNTSTMEATAGGILTIDTNVNNTGGTITASGTLSTVDISGGFTITGGTLNATSTAVLETAPGSSAVLQGVTLSAGSTYVSTNNSNTTLLGTIDNLGTLEQIGGNGNNGALDIGNSVTLTGSGTVTLDTLPSGGNAYLQGNGQNLTNTNNTIEGTGVIGNGSLALINHGVVDAMPEGGTTTLTLNGSGGITNTSTMEATAGGILTIDTNVNNTGGSITASGTLSTVDIIGGVTITGGTLNATGPAVLETATGSSAVLQGVTLSAGSTYVSTNNSNTTLLDTIDNLGTLEQIGGNGNNGALDIGNSVTLTGGGTVMLDQLTGGGADYVQGNSQTLTNTNNKIEGTGVIGNGSLALINGGVIDATPEGGTSTLTINTSGAFSSTGTLEATGGATLALNVGAATVSGLVSVAASSALDLTGELTVNGTLANFGAVSGGGATEVAFGSGTDRLILGPNATFGGTVAGGGVNSTIELAAGAGPGTLGGPGTEFTNFGTVIVDAGATWTVDATTAQLATTTFIGNGGSSTLVLTDFGTFGLSNVSDFGTIDLQAGNNTVTVTDKTLSGVAVTINDGASGNNTVSAATDTSASKGKTLNYFTGTGTDSLTGGFENDVVHVSAAAVGGDVLTGGSGANTLILTSAGSVNLGGVSKFGTVDLSTGNNTVTLTDTTLSGGTVLLYDGTSGNDTVSAAGDTSASKGKALDYFTGPGTDSFTGGFENDNVNVAAAAVGGDVLTGGSGTNTLTLTSAGTANLGGVSKFRTIDLAAGNNTVTLTDTTLSGGTVLLYDGTSGNNTVSAAGDTSASKGKALNYFTRPGTDSFTGGFENDQVHVSAAAVGGDVLTGGSGANALFLASAGTVNLNGVSKFGTVDLFAGNNTVTLTDTTLSGGTVVLNDGSSGNDTVSASNTTASKGKALNYFTGAGTDSFTGGFENDTVHVSAAAVGGDTLTGSNGTNVLIMTSASTVNLGGVSRFGAIDLAAGNSTVTVTNTTLSGGAVTINDGASGNNTVSAAGDTSASKAKTLIYFTGSGTDSFTGGFETDIVHVSASAVGGDTLTGGSGGNTLMLSSAGTVNLGGVSKFATIVLAAGNNTVTVTDTTLSGPLQVTIYDGASGNNTVSAAGDTSASTGKTLNYFTDNGADKFTGGFENDAVRVSAAAVGGDTLTGGSGSNTLILTSAGTVNLGGVSKFHTINLQAGGNTVTVTDTTLSGGTVLLYDGTSGNNTVSAVGDTSASKGKALNYFTGPGTDSFTGGFENDQVQLSAVAVGGDMLTGGSGANALFLNSAGTFNLGNVSKFGTVDLFAGNNSVTLTDTTLSGGTVVLNDGASGKDIVSAAGDTSASKGKALNYFTGAGTDSFTGGFENDTVHVSAAAVGGDTLAGGSGVNSLLLTSAGTVKLGGVSKFGTINLAAGNNTVTLTDTTLSGGTVALNDGASGNDTVSAATDTSASTGKVLNYFTGAGTDSFTGGFEKDTVHVSAAALGSDTLTGGSGTNTLTLSSAGTVNLGGVSKFGTINLASGSNTVTVTDTTLSGGLVTINAGSTGNDTVSAAGDTTASKGTTLTFYAGSGTNGFTGGQENDTIYAGTGLGSFTAGSGSDTFVFIKSNLPNQTLNNFQVSTDDILVYGTHSAGGFDLGSTDNALNPTTPTAISVADFVANAGGDFTNSSQRFAYDMTNGQLHYSATGSNTSESLFATFTGAPSITAGNILFEH